MGIAYNTSVVRDGLVFYYDMGNTQKSWRGRPSTNILNANLSSFGDIYNKSTKTIISSNEVRWVNNGSGDSAIRLYVDLANLTNGNSYGVSVYVKDIVGTISFDWCDTTIVGTNTLSVSGRLAGIGTRSTYDSTFRFLDINIPSGGAATLYDAQVDSVPNVTNYIPPTTSRSNTQSILDLTNNNTITATSLTYNADNTFSFDGSSNYIDVANNLGTLSQYTISFWAKRDAEGRMPIGWRAGPTFYWYGDNSWYYTHGGVSGEYYYSKPTSIPLGAWGNYCVTYDGSSVRIYRQGVFQGSRATTGSADWTNGLRIGYWAGGTGYHWQGRIDSVQMYNKALSATEVKQNFEALRDRYGI